MVRAAGRTQLGAGVTELLSALSLCPCWAMEGMPRRAASPSPATIQTPASPTNPWTTSTRPSSLDLQGLQLALLGWRGRGPEGRRLSQGEPRLLLSASHNEQQYTRLLVQRGRGERSEKGGCGEVGSAEVMVSCRE